MSKGKLLFVFLFFVVLNLFSQRTTIYIEPDKDYKTAINLFEKKQFNAALRTFDIYVKRSDNTLVGIDAEFYAAACAIELFHREGEWRMKEFIKKHPESIKIKQAYFYLGKSNFRKKKYEETIQFLEQVDIYELEKDELAELYFKRGYSYLEAGKTDKAKLDFFEIKDVDNKYAHPANYYYSHIAYLEKNYATAVEGFLRLTNNETFGSVVPFYIVQIYFLQGKYDEVIKVAPPLLNDSNFVQKRDEINQLIGESYFKLKDYKNSLPYLSKHGASTAHENYQLAFANFQMENFAGAIPYFENATANDDSIAQSAFYHLAGCHIKLNQKTKARSCFFNAQKLSYDSLIKERSMYNFALLCYEQDFNPFSESVFAFNNYITNYPNSPQKDEAYTYLVNCFYLTKNYTQAISVIEKINSPDIILKQIHQKMLYFKGVEFYNNIQLDSARFYFLKAISQDLDPVITAKATYWNAEIYYLNREYNKAIEAYKSFQLFPGSYGLKEYEISNYNIGYCYFQLKGKQDYENAGIAFRKYISAPGIENDIKKADAFVRTGDCYFLSKTYESARNNYEAAIQLKKIDVDYAIYQKAICDGLLKNYQEKINGLKQLENEFSTSPYISSVSFEIAEAYKALKDDDNAINYYKKTLEKYPNSSVVNDCITSIGLIYYNRKEDDKAFEYFDQIVKKDPKSDASQSVLPLIKEIFKTKNDPEGLENYFTSIGSSVNSNELDVQYFEKARKLYYDDKNCDLAFSEMQKYIGKYPSGKFILEANFCMAECAYSKENFTEALKGYEFVNSKPRSLFSEIALQKSAYINFKDKNYDKSLPLYLQLQDISETAQNKLTGKLGAMRAAYYLKKYDDAVEQATKVMDDEKSTAQQITEARTIRGKSLFLTDRKAESVSDLKYLTKNAKNENGAEAYYLLAEYYYSNKDFDEVEKTVNSLFNYAFTTTFWSTKAMLIMADLYIEKNEEQNAEAVLQTIIDNAEHIEFTKIAEEKLRKLKEKQQARIIPPVETNMQIEFKNTNTDTKLYDSIAPVIDSTKIQFQPQKIEQ